MHGRVECGSTRQPYGFTSFSRIIFRDVLHSKRSDPHRLDQCRPGIILLHLRREQIECRNKTAFSREQQRKMENPNVDELRSASPAFACPTPEMMQGPIVVLGFIFTEREESVARTRVWAQGNEVSER